MMKTTSVCLAQKFAPSFKRRTRGPDPSAKMEAALSIPSDGNVAFVQAGQPKPLVAHPSNRVSSGIQGGRPSEQSTYVVPALSAAALAFATGRRLPRSSGAKARKVVRQYADPAAPNEVPLQPELYTEAAWKVVQAAVQHAATCQSQFVETEHLFLALLDQDKEGSTQQRDWKTLKPENPRILKPQTLEPKKRKKPNGPQTHTAFNPKLYSTPKAPQTQRP